MFDPSGNAVARYLYDPYGNLIASTGPMAEANLYRFSSKEYDPRTGLYDFGFRWYDPNLQRWINEDPLGERFDKNLFRFVYSNPVKFVDPNGLWGVDFGDWDLSWGDPTFAFDWDSWSDAQQGAYATIDGFLPLIDPFAEAGYYNPCDKWLKGSQFIGALWRDASIAAIGGSVIKSVGGASAYSQLSFSEKLSLKRSWIGELVSSSVSPGYNALYSGAGFFCSRSEYVGHLLKY